MSEQQQVSALVERLAAWVEQQPEYPMLFLADRAKRKRAATIVAKRLMLLPSVPAEVSRSDRRQAQARLQGLIRPYKVAMSKRSQRQRAEAEKQRRRYARLSQERMAVLVEQAYAQTGDEE